MGGTALLVFFFLSCRSWRVAPASFAFEGSVQTTDCRRAAFPSRGRLCAPSGVGGNRQRSYQHQDFITTLHIQSASPTCCKKVQYKAQRKPNWPPEFFFKAVKSARATVSIISFRLPHRKSSTIKTDLVLASLGLLFYYYDFFLSRYRLKPRRRG